MEKGCTHKSEGGRQQNAGRALRSERLKKSKLLFHVFNGKHHEGHETRVSRLKEEKRMAIRESSRLLNNPLLF